MRTAMLRRSMILATGLLASAPALGQVCDLDSPASPSALVDTGFNQSVTKDGNGGWYTTADPVTGKYPFLEAGTWSPGQSFRVTGQVGNYQGTSGTNYRDLDFIRFKVTAPCYAVVTYSLGRDAGGFTVPFGSGEVSDLSVYTGNVETSTTAKKVYGTTDSDGCPHQAAYTYADGHRQARIPLLPSGDALIVATTASNPTGSTAYNGPILYAVDVQIVALDSASCGTATNSCTTAAATPGCSDAACCDTVCALSAACCTVAWDAACIQAGVSECGNFVYACAGSGPSNDCATSPQIIDVASTPTSAFFDTTNANTDGPNDLNTLCASMTAKDIWYQFGPMPEDGDITVTLCGLGNQGDSVITTYNLGTTLPLDGQTLAAKYRGCKDDSCDEDADGVTDQGGAANYTLVNVVAGSSYLIRIGTYLAPGADPSAAAGLQGEVRFNVRRTLWNSGRQKSVVRTADNSTTNLPLATGYRSASQPDYMVATPIEIAANCQMDGIEFCASTALQTGSTAIADRVQWVLFARDSSTTAWMGTWDAGANAVVAQGELIFDTTKYNDISSDAGKRYFFDLPAPVSLAAGSYFIGLKGTKAGSATGALGMYVYGVNAIEHTNPANGRPCYWKCDNFTGAPATWSLLTAGSSPTYRVQTGDRAGVLYQVPVKLKGVFTGSGGCFGDIDGSFEVDNGDVAFALLDYGPCPGCPSDLDGTGEVDFGDVALILLSVGPCS